MPGLPRSIRVLVAAAGAVALLALTGCGPLDAVASQASASPSAQAGGPKQAIANPSPSASGTSDDEVQQVLQSVVDYWTEQFRANGQTFVPATKVVPYAKVTEASCAGSPVELGNAFYCPTDNTVLYDVNWVRSSYQKWGRSFLFFLFAHEYGHSVQTQVGANHLITITYELQADCLSGAFLGDSVRDNKYQLTDADFDGLKKSLTDAADPATDSQYEAWFHPLAHGSMAKRMDAFTRGYQNSYGACHLDSNKGVVLKPV
ncbi:neutral zinc metallopeptidase [Cryptosporangium sp. NPDC051539]|uniref:neutral zinc metallopeptidase n=1 Tax=Cryptosporangium sp. NPDC051539 TaxID=3363962 RepID=UPI0037A60C5E